MKKEELYELLGQVNETYVKGAEEPMKRENRHIWTRMGAIAAVVALMLCSGVVGALAFGGEKQEAAVLEDLGITLIFPDSWKGKYQIIPWEGQYAVVSPEAREACLKMYKAEWEADGLTWDGELEENPFTGGMLFYITGVPGAFTPAQVAEEGGWGEAFTEGYQYLFATKSRTYLLAYASDVQCTPDTRNQYDALAQSVEDIQVLIGGVLK